MYSANDCIKDNNFEESFSKWEKANSRWKSHWFETCVTIFKNCKEWAKKYVIDTVKKTISKVSSKVLAPIVWNCENKNWKSGTELFYLIRGFNGAERVFSKIGTTTREVEKRMKEHLAYYNKHGIPLTRIEIDKVYECDTEAEGVESWFRAVYIRKYKGSFKKNDRFFGVDFDLKEADKIFADYVGLAV